MTSGRKNRRFNGWKTLAIVLIVILVLSVCCCAGFYLKWRSEGHRVLRTTRNVWTSLYLTHLEYYDETSMYDSARLSGLKEAAEEQVRDYTGCKGEIRVLSYNVDEIPTAMIYIEDNYSVFYYLDDNSSRRFEVYRNFKLLDIDGGAMRVFSS